MPEPSQKKTTPTTTPAKPPPVMIREAPSPPKSDQLRRRSLPDKPTGRRWAGIPAWLVSTVFHVLILVLLVALWQPIRRGTGGQPDREVGIAMVRETQDGSEYFLVEGGGSDGNATDASAAAATAAALPTEQGPSIDLDSILSELTGTADGSVAMADGGNSAGTNGLSGSGATGDGPGGAKKSKTQFLGIEGTGNSFVYVLDRSDSMNAPGGKPLAKAKQEVSTSIRSLEEGVQFQIVFYNESPTQFRSTLSGGRSLLFANRNEKEQAAGFVRDIRAFGGTEHLPALSLGLNFKPDVLFFMTDANEPALNQAQLFDIARKCDSVGTTVHTIEFGTGPAQNSGGWLRQLAEKTNGRYRYVDVNSL